MIYMNCREKSKIKDCYYIFELIYRYLFLELKLILWFKFVVMFFIKVEIY